MTNLYVTSLALASAVLITTSAAAQEKKVQRSALPAAVGRTVDSLSHGLAVKGFSEEREHGQHYWEAELSANGHGKDVLMDSTGAVVEVEEEIVFDVLPAPVKAGLTKRAAGGAITKVESLTKRGVLVAYEAQLMINGKHREIQVGPDGESLKHEE